ncbi:MFS general substrate transporter [Pholiota conissans]|uniref:MFS general substrate transporter n=1 Tax=Pholiota conissans TaxID=109636 RepID=A0A9P6CYF6_9AGAR|nr:MFS general substrate transporter [Pholiota conissans]
MSRTRSPIDIVAPDPLITTDTAAFSPPRPSLYRPSPRQPGSSLHHTSFASTSNMSTSSSSGAVTLVAGTPEQATETDESRPLLDHSQQRKKKPFYRARPLWLVPFAVLASLVRGMTLAPRVEVFTQLSCNRLHGGHNWNHTQTIPAPQELLHTALFSSLDGLGPHLHPSTLFLSSPRPRVSLQGNVSISSESPNPIEVTFPGSGFDDDTDHRDSDDTEDPRRIPSARCQSDPAVQAGAARLQTMMTTTMGLLSALTTGWWGHFGERHGRTRVLAISTLGLFLTDLTFILVSTPSSPLSQHGHILLLVAPFIEGLLGGWSTLQSGTSAYLSDCTSSGSRARIFSRFQGVVYLGFAAGPSIGGWLIQHPFGPGITGREQGKVVTTVFWVAIAGSFVNLLLMLFVFPESLNQKKMERAAAAYAQSGTAKGKVRTSTAAAAEDVEDADEGDGAEASENLREVEAAVIKTGSPGVVMRFLSPLAVFLPVMVLVPSPNGIGMRKRRDWSLTLLAVTLFGFMLSTGLFQIKYLYATHTYGWGPEQLSYYISFMGGGRAVWLLVGLPTLIGFFKPRSPPSNADAGNSDGNAGTNGKKSVNAGEQASTKTLVNGKKPKATRAQLGHEIGFDLVLTRCSLLIDVISHSLVAILPAPINTADVRAKFMALATPGDSAFNSSQAMFVVASSLNGMGSGAVPAIQSLALCIMQVRALNARSVGANGQPSGASEEAHEEEGTGALFGALAVLQAVGQMILGPLLFGLIYSGTVGTFPKAVFVVAAGIMVFALTMMMFVRNPVHMPSSSRSPGKQRRRRENGDVERGRSRVSKDLRGGAIRYGATTNSEASTSS